MTGQPPNVWAAEPEGKAASTTSAVSPVGLGVLFGCLYALFNLYLMKWWGNGGFNRLFPGLQSGVIQTGCYYLTEIFLVQVVLFPTVPATRFWALIGFLSPGILLALLQIFRSPIVVLFGNVPGSGVSF